jgi:acetoin utilization deacetylase AcuC-like enzyme
MTSALMRHAGGKVVAVLEGGYVPSLLGQCAAAVLARLLGDVPPPLTASELAALHRTTR